MKRRWLTILCALALASGSLSHAHGAEEEPLLPPPEQLGAVEQTAAPGEDATPPSPPEQEPQTPEPAAQPQAEKKVHVGLTYGSNALAGANLSNNVGSGFRFGYTDAQLDFWQVGYTSETAVSVVKTQNVYYGYNYGTEKNRLITYSDAITSDVLVGCWHVQLPGEYATFEEAQIYAWNVGGFPAWVQGGYQVRFGAFGGQEEAQAAAEQAGGTVVGTSAYGVSVVKTGTNTILFQFDGGEANSLTVKPGTDDLQKTVTNYRGSRYYGSFQFRRINGGNITVSNYLPMGDYLNCVISQEMSASWPLEALKAQAVTARTYYERNLGKHKADGFDLCSTTNCQAYPGMSRTTERTVQAVEETAGLHIWYGGELAETFYFASDGGGTENVRNVWPGEKEIPYLCGVVDPYEETIADKIAYWGYEKRFTASELTAIVQPYIQSFGYNCAAIVDFQVTEHSPTGNVMSISFTDANGKVWPFTKTNANKFRGLLSLQSIRYTVTKSGEATGGVYYTGDGGTLSTMKGVYAIGGDGKTAELKSNPFIITASGVGFLPAPVDGAPADAGEVTFTITSWGYGHNVGMSQWGAYAMAQQGLSFLDILTFYYPGVEIY